MTRHLGLADERCPCGNLIETLLDNHGRNPLRCCWACRIKADTIAEAQMDGMIQAEIEAAEKAELEEFWPCE